jgi:hypothetical protein
MEISECDKEHPVYGIDAGQDTVHTCTVVVVIQPGGLGDQTSEARVLGTYHSISSQKPRSTFSPEAALLVGAVKSVKINRNQVAHWSTVAGDRTGKDRTCGHESKQENPIPKKHRIAP